MSTYTPPSDTKLRDLFLSCKTIAVVGLSPKPDRASYGVARYLQCQGYQIVAVNPLVAGTEILGCKVYSSLTEAASNVGSIDMVDCFRKSEDILPIAEEAISIHAKCLWMQLGIENEHAASLALNAGLQVVMNRCTKIDHHRLLA